jgi:hypothetical protein
LKKNYSRAISVPRSHLHSQNVAQQATEIVFRQFFGTGGENMYVYFFLVMTTCVSLTRASRASDWGRRKMASTALCIKKFNRTVPSKKEKERFRKEKAV